MSFKVYLDETPEFRVELDEEIRLGDKIVRALTVTENGVYTGGEENGKQVAYSPVKVDVKPNPVPLTVTENGVYENENGFSPVTVNFPFQKTSGSFTRGNDYAVVKIAHGLQKPPKLVFCRHKDFPNTKLYCCGFVYTEQVTSIYYLGAGDILQVNNAHIGVPNIYAPSHGAITVDDTNINVAQTARQWHKGDYEWEAYTW